MNSDREQDYLGLEEAAAYLGVTPARLRRILKEHGVDYFTQASLRRPIMIGRDDLDRLRSAPGLRSSRRAG